MSTMTVKDATGTTITIEKPLAPNRAAAALSRPVVLSNEDKLAIDALATQATAVEILAKIIAAPSTEAKQDAGNTSLSSIDSKMSTLAGYVDGLEALSSALNGYVDGLETLVTSSNTKLDTIHSDLGTTLAGLITTLNGYVDQLEGYTDGLETLVTSSNTKLDTIHTDLATTLGGFVDGLETLVTSSNTKLDTIHTDLGTTLTNLITTLNGYVDQLEGYTDGLEGALGISSGSAVITDANGTIQQYLRGLVTQWIAGTLVVGAGNNHIGQVGGITPITRPTITVQATPDYSDGDSIGPLITLSNFARVAAGSGIITRFAMRTKLSGGILVQTFLHIFDSNPSSTTFTDNGALTLNSADYSKILKTIAIASSDWVAPKGVSPWYTCEVIGRSGLVEYLEYSLASGRDLYFAWEADGTINFAATDDVAAVIAQIQD